MPRQPTVLSPAQRAQFLQQHESLSDRELAQYYTFSSDDLKLIAHQRRPHNRLGFAVQLGYLRFPGRPLRPDETVSLAILNYVASQLKIAPEVFSQYAHRDPTRREHLAKLQKEYGYHSFNSQHYQELVQWLLPLALNIDKAVALVEAVLGEMRSRQILLPALSTVERLVWQVRRQAEQLLFAKLTATLTEVQKQKLDSLTITVDGCLTSIGWLKQPPSYPSPNSFLKLVERIEFIRDFNLTPELGQDVHPNRLTQLAREGAKYTNQKLEGFNEERRYATLVAFLLETLQELTDRSLALHDRLLGNLLNRTKQIHLKIFGLNGRAINEKVRLYADIGKALIKARENQIDLSQAIESVLPWNQFIESVEEARVLARPQDFSFFPRLKNQYSYLRRYAPTLLSSFEFQTAPNCKSLLEAIHLLRQPTFRI